MVNNVFVSMEESTSTVLCPKEEGKVQCLGGYRVDVSVHSIMFYPCRELWLQMCCGLLAARGLKDFVAGNPKVAGGAENETDL